MESAKADSPSSQIGFQEDLITVLDGTKRMMEHMELQKEEIAELEQNITKNEKCLTNIRHFDRNLKETINENFADIENRSNFTNGIEEYCNTKFIPRAQTVQTTLLDFNEVITSIETTLKEFIGIVNENEQIYNKRIQYYNQKETQLKTELEESVKVHFQDKENKETLAKENSALILEIEDFTHEVVFYEKKIKDVIGFEENNNLKKEIIMLNDQLKNQDDEILLAFKSFDSINLQSQDEDASISLNIVNYENKIRELFKDSQHLGDKLKSLVNKENNYNTELLLLKNAIKKSEINQMTLSNKSEALNKKTIEREEVFKEINSLKERSTKIEESIKCDQEINSRLSKEIEERKTDIELLNSEVDLLKVVITDLVESPKEDVGRQSEVKQDKLNELNLEHQKAEETYKMHLIEKQEMLQAVITDTESGNTKMSEYIRKKETELKEIQDKTKQLQEEKKAKEKFLLELEKPVIPTKRSRRWDSDSTIGEEKW